MKSFNGVELEVGQKVVVLQVPVIGEHQFIHAEVKSISPKTVLVEGLFRDKWIGGLNQKRGSSLWASNNCTLNQNNH